MGLEGWMSYALEKLKETPGEKRNWPNYALKKIPGETIREMWKLPYYALGKFPGETMRGMRNWPNYALEKWPKYAVEKFPWETMREMRNWPNYVLEKLRSKEWLVGSLIAKPDEVFLPEQMKHWLQVAPPFIIVAVVLYLCYRCGGGGGGAGRVVVKIMKVPLMMVTAPCMVAVKMMKAPGRPGMSIPRAGFEANPRAYFRDLRGK